MTPAETIQAAIDKLMDQAAAADHGPYRADDEVTGNGHVIMGQEGRVAHLPADVHTGSETADLLVTLHATIDAQLLIMRNELEEIAIDKKESGFERPPHHDVFTLARAILGEQVDE